jgi:hypothetical protein
VNYLHSLTGGPTSEIGGVFVCASAVATSVLGGDPTTTVNAGELPLAAGSSSADAPKAIAPDGVG